MAGMDTQPRRSRRQLYLGFFFVGLALIAALIRTFTVPATNAETDYTRIEEVIGLPMEQVHTQLGEPTATLEFNPADDPNPLRRQVSDRLMETGASVPEQIIEQSWFDGDTITTIWFIAGEADEPPVSIDSVRYRRSQSGTALD